jgi:hypothetical protein
MIDKLLSEYVNHSDKERKIGRYYSSEIGSIIKGYQTPEKFFIKKKIDKKGVGNILSGMAFEAELKRALDHSKVEYIHEPKKELVIDKDIVISVKPDFEFKDKILETKFPVSLGSPADYLERYKHQMECQYRAFNKDVYMGVFSHPFSLKIYKYEPSDHTYEEIIKAVKKFHKELCHLKKK